VGRCIAERRTVRKASFITLTYGRNKQDDPVHERTVSLTYRDIKNWFKLLRKHGYPCRYIVTGEFGTKNKRAHWHAIVFWEKEPPPWSGFDQWGKFHANCGTRHFNHCRTDGKGEPVTLQNGETAWFWPWGFIKVKPVSTATIRYVCKYIYKDVGDSMGQGVARMSRMPALGHDYFIGLARKMMKLGIVPQDLRYRFADVTEKAKDGKPGKPVEFYMKGAIAEHFMKEVQRLRDAEPNRRWNQSTLLDNYDNYGKVVVDENAHRQAKDNQQYRQAYVSPRRMHTPDEMKAIKAQHDAELEERKALGKKERWLQWWSLYVKGAWDGEERQKRGQEFVQWFSHEYPEREAVREGRFVRWDEDYHAEWLDV